MDVWIGDGRFYTGLDEGGGGGKDQIAPLCDSGIQQSGNRFLRPVFIKRSRYFIRESLLQIKPAQLMGVGPGTGPRCLFIDKGNFQPGGG